MILVFVLLGILILVIALITMLVFSTFKIQVEDLQASNMEPKQKLQYKITFALYLGNKIKWLWISLTSEKVKRIVKKMPLAKIDMKKIEKDFRWQDLKTLKKLKLKLSKLDVQASLGLESPTITAFLVASLASGISILLPHFVEKMESSKYQYRIIPVYQNKNLYKINLNCIIELKMVHIINVIYIFSKKGKSDENERTTSNRKSYGYSYE